MHKSTCLFLALSLVVISLSPATADPLHIAVRSLDLKLFRQTMQENPAVNATDSAGMTPLHHACALGAVEMVTSLLAQGADINFRSNDGRNALHHTVNIQALCFNPQPQAGEVTICPLTVPQLLASAGIDVNAADSAGETALHIAARNGLVGVIATLLQCGANPDCRNQAGETPLHLCGGSLAHLAAQVLLVGGANPALARNDGRLPIDMAASASNALLVNMIKRYAQPEKP
ncbi:MAG TPA: ankyrin repeat domain-containing protein [Candidatus Rifleibacterium sp.]|nr:ankyrin repeat domain-containing protein [Candidatus Rifleibacterium sp.]